MMSKTMSKIFMSIFALVLLMNFASADINLYPNHFDADINHGSSTDFNFVIHNDALDANHSIINLEVTSSALTGPETLSSSNINIGFLPSIILKNSNSSPINVEISIPKNTLYGTYTGSLTISGDHNGTSSGPHEKTLNIQINVSRDPSLKITGGTIETDENSTAITIENTGNTYLPNIELNSSGNINIEFNNSGFGLNPGDKETVLVTLVTSRDTLPLGDTSININAKSTSASDSSKITIKNSYCECKNKGELEVKIDDVSVKGLGDEDVWYPLDHVEVELKIENNGDWDIQDVKVKWGLYDPDEDDFIIDDSEKKFDLDKGDDKTITVEFDLKDPEDYENKNFVFYAKATGEIDDSDSPYDGNDTCGEDSEDVEVGIDNDMVALGDISIPTTAFCNSKVEVFADVWNIGDDDQDDVVVRIFNSDLGLDKKISFDTIDSFEKEELSTTFEIPSDAEEKVYPITFVIYDEDGDTYETEEDEKAIYKYDLEVKGGCISSLEKDIDVNAKIESGGDAGSELQVIADLTNIADETKAFSINVANYEDWAELKDVNTTNILLDKDKSAKILLTFDVDKKASGRKTFDLLITSEGQTITQPITVSIKENTGLFSKLSNAFSEGNASVWGIAIINIILIIVIIVVVIRLLRK